MVSSHEGTSTFILLDEGNQSGRGTNDLLGNNIYILDFVDIGFNEFAVIPDRNPLLSDNIAVSVYTCMGNIGVFFVVCSQIDDFITNFKGSFAVFDDFVYS